MVPVGTRSALSVPSAPPASTPTPTPAPTPDSGGAGRRFVRSLVRWRALVTGLGARAGMTPGLMCILSVALVGAMALLWAVSFSTVIIRQDAVEELSGSTGLSFAATQRIHADLSEADATVARAFLTVGVEPLGERAAFQRSIESATRDMIVLARAGGPAEVQEPLAVLASQIPVYTGMVERARTNNRVGFVVGAAYLRQASALMQNTILPAVDTLAAFEAGRIDHAYTQATRWYHPALVATVGAVTLAGLLSVQLFLSRRTRRVLNLPLAAATVVVMITIGIVLAAFSVERSRLVDGRDHGFVPMTIVAQARALALRAWGDESLALIARGNGAVHDADADAVAARLGYDASGRPTGSGVLPDAVALGGPDAETRAGLDDAWDAYHATSLQVRQLVSEVGGFQKGVKLALSKGNDTFRRFDEAADAALARGQERFDDQLLSADDSLGGLAGGVTGALTVVALLSLAGLQLRINEYR